jgi:hypothetical protein
LQFFGSEPPTAETHFVCPEQPNLVLPLSRLHDGICDCCDGSDEDPRHDANVVQGSGTLKRNPCPDICDSVLKAEREKLAKLHNDFLVGSRKRDLDLAKFSNLRSKKVEEASKLDKELTAINSDIDDIKDILIVGLKEGYAMSRVATMKNKVARGPMATALLSSLKDKELEELLVHLCQIAGEIAKANGRDEGDDTCLALRVAALDIGLTWNDLEDYDGGTMEATLHDPTTAEEIVEIIFDNASKVAQEGPKSSPPLRWKTSSSSSSNKRGKPKRGEHPAKGRRRLDEVFDDDLHMEDDYPMYDEYMDDDGYEQRRGDQTEKKSQNRNSSEPEATGKKKELIEVIRTSLFSAARVSFLKESQVILDEIGKILDENNESGEEESSESEKPQGDDGEATPECSAKPTIDPAAYNMLRNDLRKKQDTVEMGFLWGASALLLMASLKFEPSLPKREMLEQLVVGTIYYGQISAVQTWQILQVVLPEYKVLSPAFQNKEAETTCASPWARNCPPRHVYRESPEGTADAAIPGMIEYPPSNLLEAAALFCDDEASNFGKEGARATLACQNDGDINDVGASIASLLSLPSGEVHRLVGYNIPTVRDKDSDPLQTMFQPISNLPINVQGLRSLEGRRDAKEKERSNLTNTIDSLWKSVGGKEGNDLGRNGELHAIANECFEIVAGKYTYELCLFGKAQQKEGKSQPGTNLGRWEGIEYRENNDDDSEGGDATRVLKWANGAKCWNGPKRSATMYVKCGPDHKVVSADEPDTCRYVFEMESYLACDDVYKQKMSL